LRLACLLHIYSFFFSTDTPTTQIYTLSLHDALPISTWSRGARGRCPPARGPPGAPCGRAAAAGRAPERDRPYRARRARAGARGRSEEHTSELQSRGHLVCRLLLEKKKKK